MPDGGVGGQERRLSVRSSRRSRSRQAATTHAVMLIRLEDAACLLVTRNGRGWRKLASPFLSAADPDTAGLWALVTVFVDAARAEAALQQVLGEERPAVAGHDESAWAKNRRVEIVYLAAGPPQKP